MKIGNLEVYGIIYKITNMVNGKVYIGQTTRGFNERYDRHGIGIERVYNYHMSRKMNKEYYNKHLLSAIIKYGFNNFKIEEVFDIAYSKKELDELEIKYINLYNSMDKNYGYNKTMGGANGIMTEEVRMKISKSLKGKMLGAKHPMYGKHLTTEAKLKISRSKFGKYQGERSYNFGRTGQLNGKSVKIKCITTNEVFESANLASQKYNCDRSSIIKNCKGKRKSAGKLHGIRLVWEYAQ